MRSEVEAASSQKVRTSGVMRRRRHQRTVTMERERMQMHLWTRWGAEICRSFLYMKAVVGRVRDCESMYPEYKLLSEHVQRLNLRYSIFVCSAVNTFPDFLL